MTKGKRAKAALDDDRNAEIGWERWIDDHIETIREALEQMADEGTVRVPREPTYLMKQRGSPYMGSMLNEGMAYAEACYRAMVIAAQESNSEGGG